MKLLLDLQEQVLSFMSLNPFKKQNKKKPQQQQKLFYHALVDSSSQFPPHFNVLEDLEHPQLCSYKSSGLFVLCRLQKN